MKNCPGLDLSFCISLNHVVSLAVISLHLRSNLSYSKKHYLKCINIFSINTTFLISLQSIPHELFFHIEEAYAIIRILTLVRNPRLFTCEQDVIMNTAEFLVFYHPKQPRSTAKVALQQQTSDLHQMKRTAFWNYLFAW